MALTNKFRIKPGDEPLSRADFEEWPAWSEHYDYEDLDLIASWGIDRDWVARQFREMDAGGSHPCFTILDLENLPHDNMRIFLKAEFQHKSGLTIDGYVMNASAFLIGLFVGERKIAFSCHPDLRELHLPLAQEVEKELGISELFPLSYRTSFKNREGQPIMGQFVLGERRSYR